MTKATSSTELSIPRRLLLLGWPLIVTAMLGFASNAIARFWFGEELGAAGIALHTATSPVVALTGLLLGGIGMGTGVTIARSVGARDGQGLTLIGGAFVLVGIVWLVVVVVMFVVSWPLSEFLAKSAVPSSQIREYLLWWCVLAYPASGVSMLVVTAANAAGLTRFALSQAGISILATLLLLPLFLGPLDQGYRSPAFTATCSALINATQLWFRLRKVAAANHLGTSANRRAMFNPRLWRSILDIGLPAQLARATAWIVMISVTVRVAEEGVVSLAAYGIAMAFVEIAGAASGGFAGAVQITLAQTLGAKDTRTARRVLRVGLVMALAFPAVAVVIYGLFASPLVESMAAGGATQDAGERALRFMMFTLFPASVWQVLLQAFAAARATKRVLGVTLIAQAIAFGIAHIWDGDRMWGALTTIGAMYTLAVGFYLLLAIPVLWRGALADRPASS